MEGREKGQREPAPSRSLREAIRQARLDEAVGLDRTAGRRSAELARLEMLKAGLERYFEEIPDDEERFDLALAPSLPARLWIDMFAYVAVDPVTGIYRLVRNSRQGQRVLAETADIGAISEHVVGYVARQIVARERQENGLDASPRRPPLPLAPPPPPRRARASVAMAAFLIGLLTGIVGVLAVALLIMS